jgi:hypothetical protein
MLGPGAGFLPPPGFCLMRNAFRSSDGIADVAPPIGAEAL